MIMTESLIPCNEYKIMKTGTVFDKGNMIYLIYNIHISKQTKLNAHKHKNVAIPVKEVQDRN